MIPNMKRRGLFPVMRTLSEHDSNRLHSAPFESLRDLSDLTRFSRFRDSGLHTDGRGAGCNGRSPGCGGGEAYG